MPRINEIMNVRGDDFIFTASDGWVRYLTHYTYQDTGRTYINSGRTYMDRTNLDYNGCSGNGRIYPKTYSLFNISDRFREFIVNRDISEISTSVFFIKVFDIRKFRL